MAQAKAKNVSFMPLDEATVKAVAKADGASFSMALRRIIREWTQQTALRGIAQAHLAGVITGQETLDRLAVLLDREPAAAS